MADNPPCLPPCKVCGEKGAGFHYGVNTCEACKGFFHRSLKYKHTYKCTGSGNCDLRKVRKRRTCQLCRYNRCLSIGMCREAIKTGRYTSKKKTDDILEIKRLVSNYASGTGSPASDTYSTHGSAVTSPAPTEILGQDQEYSPSPGRESDSVDVVRNDTLQCSSSTSSQEQPLALLNHSPAKQRAEHDHDHDQGGSNHDDGGPLHDQVSPASTNSTVISQSYPYAQRAPEEGRLDHNEGHMDIQHQDSHSQHFHNNFAVGNHRRDHDKEEHRVPDLYRENQFYSPHIQSPLSLEPESAIQSPASLGILSPATPRWQSFTSNEVAQNSFSPNQNAQINITHNFSPNQNVHNQFSPNQMTNNNCSPNQNVSNNFSPVQHNSSPSEIAPSTFSPTEVFRTLDSGGGHSESEHELDLSWRSSARAAPSSARVLTPSNTRLDGDERTKGQMIKAHMGHPEGRSHGNMMNGSEDRFRCEVPMLTGNVSSPAPLSAKPMTSLSDPSSSTSSQGILEMLPNLKLCPKVSPNECTTVRRTRLHSQKRLYESLTKLFEDITHKIENPEEEGEGCSNSNASSPAPSCFAMGTEEACKLEEIRRLYMNKEEAIQAIVTARRVYMNFLMSRTNIITDPVERRKVLERHVESCTERTNVFGPMEYLPDHIYDDIWTKTGIDADGRKAILEEWQVGTETMVTALVRFSKHLPGFKLLHPDTQAELVKSARIEFNLATSCGLFDPELKAGILIGSNFIHCPREIGQLYSQGFYDHFTSCSKRLQELQLTEAETAIMEALIVFSTDRLDLGPSPSTTLATAVHWELIQCLRCLLARRSLTPDLWLAKVIACLTELRTAQDKHKEAVISGMKALKYSSLLENPLMRELFSNILAMCQDYPKEYEFLIVPFFKLQDNHKGTH